MKKNTSGAASAQDYHIGRGKLHFAEHDANGRPMGYELLGNCPDLTISVEPETYEHQSSMEGLRTTDLELILEQNLEVSFTLEAANTSNMSRFLSGAESSMAVGTAAGEAAEVDIVGAGYEQIVGGRWYDLVKLVGTTETRYMGIQQASDVTLTFLDDATPVSLTLGTDYDLDLKFGRVFLKPESAKVIAAAADDDQKLQMELAPNVAAPSTVNTIQALTRSEVRGALKFISENANSASGAVGKFAQYDFWNVNLVPSGEMQLISDEVGQMQFTASCTKSIATGHSLTIFNPDYT